MNPVTQTITASSEEETAALAHRLASALKGGEYISLEGDLGAGKTFFSRALARSLGITEVVTSPTFVVQKIYAIPCHHEIERLIHYDFYRIQSYHELIDMGFEDHDTKTVVLAEWGNLFINEFPMEPMRIKFETQPTDQRLITITGISLIP